jgi:hypothetical protein
VAHTGASRSKGDMGTRVANGNDVPGRAVGWVINQHDQVTFAVESLLLNYVALLEAHRARNLAPPNAIWGECESQHM